MCQKTNYKTCNTRIDKCLINLINFLKESDYNPIASCCGHNKYPLTVVVEFTMKGKIIHRELFSRTVIPRKKKFYKRDNEGYYYIPEVSPEIKK